MNQNVPNARHDAVSQQRAQQAQHVVYHDFDGAAELTTTLAHAISDVTGVDVTDTGFTLADYVDPDALDKLFRPSGNAAGQVNAHLSLTIWGCQVAIYDNGQIVVTPIGEYTQPHQPR